MHVVALMATPANGSMQQRDIQLYSEQILTLSHWQAVSGIAVLAIMAPLIIGSQLLEIVQGDGPVELPKF